MMCLFVSLILSIIIQTNGLFKHRIAPIRPSIIEEHHNKNRMLLSFSSDCCQSIRTVKHYIKSLQLIYPCLYNTNINKIYKENNGNYHTYLSIKYINYLHNISCIDNININWNNFCLDFIDYELQFEQASITNTDDNDNDIATCNIINSNNNFEYLWHLDYIDGTIDNKYIYNNNTYKYKNIDIFILDQSIQSTHIEFNTINYYKFDPNYNEKPMTEHGTHIAAIIVGKNVGITQGSLNIPIYDYPICRYTYGGCSFQLLENALIKIITFIKENNIFEYPKRIIIYLGIQTNGLPSTKWIDILDNLFQQIINLGGIIIASAGSKNINGCYSYPGGSPYVISVAAYKNNFQIFGNYGNCVDFYAPGNYIYSADLGHDNKQYKRLKGTSMSAAIITGLIANMLWINNKLTIQQIKNLLKSPYHSYNVVPSNAIECQINGCYLIHWNCDAYNTEILNYSNHTIAPTFIPNTRTNTPSITPTFIPTNTPTFIPSNMPIYMPSNVPTITPTTQPSNIPTQLPQTIQDLRCLLPQNIKPCECFIHYDICVDIFRCQWDINTVKCIQYIPPINTKSPTNNPQYSTTNIPTNNPHISPTNIPTYNPQISPTRIPTNHPHISPSYNPQISPTNTPTNMPISPTNMPISKSPTNIPTHNPQMSPTKIPTNNPQKSPTNIPTSNPHISPTNIPTNMPTNHPQISLTNNQQMSPTNMPTYIPTFNPQSSPTNMPTNKPTYNPQISPTNAPCLQQGTMCDKNKQCCSGICVRFRTVSHCV